MSTTTKAAAPTRPAFALKGSAEIRHINVRKEGPEEDKELAADIKLRFSGVPRAILPYFDDKLEAFLWDGSAAMIVRKMNMEPVRFTDIVNGNATIAGQAFQNVTVKKFELEPQDGGTVDLTCSVTVFPTQLQIGELAREVQESVPAVLEAFPDLFDKPAEKQS